MANIVFASTLIFGGVDTVVGISADFVNIAMLVVRLVLFMVVEVSDDTRRLSHVAISITT
jgi:hypothetical protein